MIKVFNLNQLNLQELKKEKFTTLEGYIRTVYYDKKNKWYIKIWKSNYFWKKNFINGLEKKFYEEITPLLGVIEYKGDFIGYITEEVSMNNNLKLIKKCNISAFVIDSFEKQPGSYIIFLEKLRKKYLETGLYFLDLTPDNIGIKDNVYYMVDIESVSDKKIEEEEKFLKYCPVNYEKIFKIN